MLSDSDPPWKAEKGLKAPFQCTGQDSAQGKASVQALEKELANFGKEKDKHIRNAQGKAKKAKADTEVMFPCALLISQPVLSSVISVLIALCE